MRNGDAPHEGARVMTPNTMIQLLAPALDLEAAYQDCEAEFNAHGEAFLGAGATDWPAYVEQCAEEARGIVRDPARVPQTVLLLARVSPSASPDKPTGDKARQARVLGVAKLRHLLTPTLEDIGGHIGYNIRPSERGKGYGTLILALTLDCARELGLSRVLLTCDTDNIRSARVIMRNGGVLTSEGYSPLRGARVSRYWIAL
ncbi:MAG: GNAT family N-acetyltransferase [Ktedonobacterales bacterium]